MNIPEKAAKALKMLNSSGYQAWLVGGCMRDILMGKECGDIDITTNALPQQTEIVFKDYTIIETGIKHGTITVMIDGEPLEITTYRTESEYGDNRHPDAVEFTADLYQDTCRRDFTMNSVCYNPDFGIRDYHSGAEDIANGIIRCIGSRDERFKEDALRILRGVRFAAVLGFKIEDETAKAMLENRQLLKNISAERIYSELKKALCGKYIRPVLIEYAEIFDVALPGVLQMKGFDQKNEHHIYDILEHTATVVENLPPEPELRLAGLLHDIGKLYTFTVDNEGVGHFYGHNQKSYEITTDIMMRLKASKEECDKVCTLVKYHDTAIPLTEKSVRRALNKYGKITLKQLIILKRADNRGQNIAKYDYSEYYNQLEKIVEKVLKEEQCFSLKQLAVKGNDLTHIGYTPSPELGHMLNELLEKVIDGQLPNDKNTLLQYVKEHK